MPFTGTTVDSCDTADSGAITGLPTYLCLFSACCPGPSCALYPQVGRLYITILIFGGLKVEYPLKNKELTHVYSPLFFSYSPASSGILPLLPSVTSKSQNLYAELFVPVAEKFLRGVFHTEWSVVTESRMRNLLVRFCHMLDRFSRSISILV